ncbi:hypothetical protein [Burkholderia ambifaria]|uniref:hypothetical protein n=1 Tax=Burkholderia ambifaria TaxID=152480 RepID=UPI001FC7D896|nr:hypothetical protein [Burkholderia ambifaria]
MTALNRAGSGATVPRSLTIRWSTSTFDWPKTDDGTERFDAGNRDTARHIGTGDEGGEDGEGEVGTGAAAPGGGGKLEVGAGLSLPPPQLTNPINTIADTDPAANRLHCERYEVKCNEVISMSTLDLG